MGNGVVLLCKLTHSFGTFVIAITGNEFCLCHWKVGTEREGRTGGEGCGGGDGGGGGGGGAQSGSVHS